MCVVLFKKLKLGVKTFPLAGNLPVQGEDFVVALDWGAGWLPPCFVGEETEGQGARCSCCPLCSPSKVLAQGSSQSPRVVR